MDIKKLSSERLYNIFNMQRAYTHSLYKCSCGAPAGWCDEDIAPKEVRDKAQKELKRLKDELSSRNWQKSTKRDKKNARRSRVVNKKQRGR